MVPTSTVCFYIVYYTGAIFWFAVLINPLTLLILNLIAPAFAASLVHDEVYCGKTICKFYTYLALKWPFKWAKWWVTPDLLKNYTVREQEIYFNEVRQDEEVLWSLSPEAWAVLMRDIYVYPFKKLANGLKERNDLFKALLDLTSLEGKERQLLKEYMSCDILPKAQLTILIEKACEESHPQGLGIIGRILLKYIKRCGTLSKAQLTLLIKKLCSEEQQHCFDTVGHILCDYVERCGISKDLMSKISDSEKISQVVKDAVAESNEAYLQKVVTKRLYNLSSIEEVDEWVKFCAKDKKICAFAQQEMSLNQYAIFHKQGHHLDAGAISYLLWYGGPEMAKQIFLNEPKFGILDSKIEFVLDKHEYLRPTLQKVIEETEADLRERIWGGYELDIEELNQMFDCPNSNDLAVEYFSRYSLPKEFHKRMLEPKNEGCLQFYISQGWLLSAYQLDDEVAEECKRLGYHLDPPEKD